MRERGREEVRKGVYIHQADQKNERKLIAAAPIQPSKHGHSHIRRREQEAGNDVFLFQASFPIFFSFCRSFRLHVRHSALLLVCASPQTHCEPCTLILIKM